MLIWRAIAPAFFRGEVLRRDTPTLVRDEELRADLGVADQPRTPRDS
jgi:hypothetical protein